MSEQERHGCDADVVLGTKPRVNSKRKAVDPTHPRMLLVTGVVRGVEYSKYRV
jgi:hypothetical protein